MEITSQQLVYIVGQKQVEIEALKVQLGNARARIQELEQQVRALDAEAATVAPAPSAAPAARQKAKG